LGSSLLAVGLMSGTSLDGIDAALIETDGEGFVQPVAFRSEPYSEHARAELRHAAAIARQYERPRRGSSIVDAEKMLTQRHIEVVEGLLASADVPASKVDVVGFHGQTLAHRPERGWTWQIGDADAMARALGIAVVSDFRGADVAAGGQGAPLLPVYHRALTAGLERPLAVLNLGGVGNITWIGESADDLIAFDTGPGNGLIDDWVMAETGRRYDEGGALAAEGSIDEKVLAAMLDNPWFDALPPKSLDRADFTMHPAKGLSAADGATTLTAFTAATVALALDHLPSSPRRLIVAGGGRHNATLMAMIADACDLRTEPIEAHGHNGDATEAEGFGYMAVRALRRLPISFPGTTGVRAPNPGGVLTRPE